VGITPGTDSWNIIISQRVMMNSVDSGTREAERAGAELAQERLVLSIFITGICFSHKYAGTAGGTRRTRGVHWIQGCKSAQF